MIGPFSISNLPSVKFDGVYRVLGCIPSDNNHDLPNFGEYMAVGATTHELREIDISWQSGNILDQKSTSSCVAQACANGMEIVWKQVGNTPQTFNPYFTYALINKGRDAGAMISDGLMALKQFGACPEGVLPNNLIFKNQLSQEAYNAAARFKLLKAYKCVDFDEVCQAINLGFSCPLGILVGRNFHQLDQEGVSPLPNGGGGGHALLGVGLKLSQRYGWLIKVENSWGKNFGRNGFCYLRREHFQYMPTDAFAIVYPSENPQNNTPVLN